MAWESRRNGRYYYSAVKRDGRVIKRYFGRGPAAELAAQLDQQARQRRQDQAAALHTERSRRAAPERALHDFETACDLLMVAALMAAGYHRTNYGPWRR